MITFRDRMTRGATRMGWLDSRHSFAFADYRDPRNQGFRALRVINEDRVIPGAGFPPHSHRDMEIITYVLEGALEHRDSLGNGSIIRPGDLQRMSAGTGIRHSEYNASAQDSVHFLQLWVIPDEIGIAPGYEQQPIDPRRNTLVLAAGPAVPRRRSRSMATSGSMSRGSMMAPGSRTISRPDAAPGFSWRAASSRSTARR